MSVITLVGVIVIPIFQRKKREKEFNDTLEIMAEVITDSVYDAVTEASRQTIETTLKEMFQDE